MIIILPQNPLFYETLENIDLFWNFHKNQRSDENLNLIVDFETGVLKNATHKEFEEYLFGGEYDERMKILSDQEIIESCLGSQSEQLSPILINGYLP